ncbi:desmocollin 2-like protein [Sphaeramia orbicularis]|uniref:Desmocollin-2-like n=1 Tax=Sphaeramia orbicularis TaxID=375764 RepID=A0A673CZN8_9TELE|nr:desmocollin-2-like [Sphaeramia orbicularis]
MNMAWVLIFNICLLLIVSRVDSCSIPQSLYVSVPKQIPVGSTIAIVPLANCDLHLSVSDPNFAIAANGELVSVRPVSVPSTRTLYVGAYGKPGWEGDMEVHLLPISAHKKGSNQGLLKRTKRRWSPPPFNILENAKGLFPQDIEVIVSDSAAKYDVYYTLSGPGYNEHPVGVFSLDSESGMLKVNKPVDREEFPKFVMTVRVYDKRTNLETDLPLPITVSVDDMNDNAPTFQGSLQFTVPEQSKAGTKVGQVSATDRDQPKTSHVKIRYSLLTGSDLFAIDPATGVITTVTNTLDREVKDKHMVTVQITDLDGAPGGLFNTGTATITLSDINDNPPTFTKTSYAASVMENEHEKLILRIPVEDKDEINTPNWISKFVITKGNENGNFRIDRDPKTNEGLLYVVKPLDHEKNPNVKLEIMARNEADLTGTTSQWLSIPVDVAVGDTDEGPEFTAPTIRFTVKENTPNGTLIGRYTAVDPETKSSDGIKYYKVTDPASWINVDKNTGELRVANTIDKESHFVQDGIYNITMRAVDASTKTGTGTVIIQVEDVNDNVPELPTGELLLCEKEEGFGSVLVVAEDKDDSPFSAPFSFSLPENDGKWSVTRFNDTAATLQQMKALHTGPHKVQVEVRDLQGNGKIQTVEVRICQCRNGVCPAKLKSASLGPLGILALLLPLFLLLLLFALLALFCVTKSEKVHMDDFGDSGGILLKSNTEAPGEEVDSSLLTAPGLGVDQAVKGSVKGSMVNAGWLGNKSSSTIGALDGGAFKSNVITTESQYYDNQYGTQRYDESLLLGNGMGFDSRYLVQDSALLHTWQTNGRYLDQKLHYLGTEGDGRYADDVIHTYGFEGVGSTAGSVGCCSDFGDDNLDFLNTLGPKFKTLADICTKK